MKSISQDNEVSPICPLFTDRAAGSGAIIDQLAVSYSQDTLWIKSQTSYQFTNDYVAAYLPLVISKEDLENELRVSLTGLQAA
jgi:hypothetical protein